MWWLIHACRLMIHRRIALHILRYLIYLSWDYTLYPDTVFYYDSDIAWNYSSTSSCHCVYGQGKKIPLVTLKFHSDIMNCLLKNKIHQVRIKVPVWSFHLTHTNSIQPVSDARERATLANIVFLLQFLAGPRYPAGPRPGVRMPQMGNDFNGVSPWNLIIWISNFLLRQD